jgi:hypothetical protein
VESEEFLSNILLKRIRRREIHFQVQLSTKNWSWRLEWALSVSSLDLLNLEKDFLLNAPPGFKGGERATKTLLNYSMLKA